MIRLLAAIFIFFSFSVVDSREISSHSSRLAASKFINDGGKAGGTRWAVLMAGSMGWDNYRHQADVCHAYQILKKGGLNDENIIVMMYDDIAQDSSNPTPGVIINHPDGDDVYSGVPKDYTGKDVTADNFFNVILGNKTAIRGGSGKVVESRPNDTIFIYYVDHGSAFMIGTPTGVITADELNNVLKKKHDSGTYKSMVFYLEACESGSMFDGLLSPKLNIYATTASNPYESSYGHYCPGDPVPPPQEFDTCLGDLYSIAWMEDCDKNSTAEETLHEQYRRAKKRTVRSHVMEYGDLSMRNEKLSVYIGNRSAKDTYSNKLFSKQNSSNFDQRDANLLHIQEKYRRAPAGSQKKLEAKLELDNALEDRKYVDSSMEKIANLLFGAEKGIRVMNTSWLAGQSPVDDWNCFKSMLHTYEENCGKLSVYGRKYTRTFANFCNAGVQNEQLEKATKQACSMN